jgi:hypothetical protein
MPTNQWQECNHYHIVDTLLRSQLLIVAVPAVYLTALCDPVITFTSTTILQQILDHLHDQYGGITESQLNSNTEQMKQH